MGLWKSKVPGTAHTTADVNVSTAADLPVLGTSAFAKTAMWTPVYLTVTASAGVVFANTGPFSWTEQ
jgi:hypothetical protein